MMIKRYFKENNLNPKREITIIILLNLIILTSIVLLVLFTKKYFLILPSVFLFLTINLINAYRIIKISKSKKEDKINEFIIILKDINFHVNNELDFKHCFLDYKKTNKPILKEEINEFILNSEVDKSFNPYIRLLKTFNSNLIEDVVLNLYKYDTNKNSIYLNEFNNKLEKLIETADISNSKNLENRLQLVCYIPLIASFITVIALIVSIINVAWSL